MTDYFIDKIKPGVTGFTSRRNHVFYLIEGTEVAYVIDTAMEAEPIRPLLETYTDKPLVLLVTHMHCDHMYHAAEFSKAYVPQGDLRQWHKLRLEAWFATVIFKERPKRYQVATYQSFQAGDCFPLTPTADIEVVEAPGHSPGSSLFIHPSEKIIFVGDAFYHNTWLWLPNSGSLSEYLQVIKGLLVQLEPYADYTFVGGHRPPHSVASETANPLISYETLKDMKELCEARLANRIAPSEQPKHGPFNLEIYRHGKAGLWLKKKVK